MMHDAAGGPQFPTGPPRPKCHKMAPAFNHPLLEPCPHKLVCLTSSTTLTQAKLGRKSDNGESGLRSDSSLHHPPFSACHWELMVLKHHMASWGAESVQVDATAVGRRVPCQPCLGSPRPPGSAKGCYCELVACTATQCRGTAGGLAQSRDHLLLQTGQGP